MSCMDGRLHPLHPSGMGVLPHVRKLDDALGHFLLRITCKCAAQRIAEPEALARLCGPTRGEPIRSFDGGMTRGAMQPGKCYMEPTKDCPEFGDPPGNKAPQSPTVTALTISWTKVDD
jgi:hypothetical protein